MSWYKTLATARRVLTQLSHDRRTLALVLLVPCLLLVLLKYVFQGEPRLFNNLAPMMLGIFPLFMMFLVTSIATLRERTTGTLDRLMTQPMSKFDLIFGYALAFSLLGLLQASIASLVTLGLLGVTVMGGTLPVLVVAVAAAIFGHRPRPVSQRLCDERIPSRPAGHADLNAPSIALRTVRSARPHGSAAAVAGRLFTPHLQRRRHETSHP